MASEPSEQDLMNIAEFTGLNPSYSTQDRQLIVNAWKAHNGNIDALVGDYFTDSDSFLKKHAWDEGAFGAGRDGDIANWDRVPSFQVHTADDQVIEGQPAPDSSFMAPTRPPSRTQSPLVAPNQEDADLQRALAESAAESARISEIHSPQETGVANRPAGGGSPTFGPATREHYDVNQWSMVPTAVTSRPGEDPGPRDRKRAVGAPAFLRCGRDDQLSKHRLGPILTVLHSVPTIRNAFLRSGGDSEQAINYGHNKEWWKGQPIDDGAGQNMDEMSRWGEPAITLPDLEHELHRLMAFLDSTERSYGTADVLLNYGNLSVWSIDIELMLFEDLKGRNETSVWRPMWNKVVAADIITGELIPQESPEFAVLDTSHSKARFLQVDTTYDLIDTTLWPQSFFDDENANDELRFAIMSQPADVLILRIAGTGLQKSLKLLPTIYTDRYLEENKDIAIKLQRQIRAVNEALAKGNKRKEELLQYRVSDFSNPLDPRELSKKVIETNRSKIAALQSGFLWRKHQEDVDSGGDADFSSTDIPGFDQLSAEEQEAKSRYEAEISLHEYKLASIDFKMKKLDGEIEMCQTLLKKLRGQLTDPCEESKWAPNHKYTLRGVITGPQTMYFCKRAEENLIVFDEDKVTSEQWWRLAYLPDAQEPLVVEQTTLELVEQSLLNETDKPILIYASDAAMSAMPNPLSESLATFVKHDNRLFKQELIEETPRADNDKKRMSADGPSSPPKRRARALSMNSMDSNRASIGDSDWGADDNNSVPDEDQVPELDHVEHVSYESPPSGPMGGIDSAFAVDQTDERFYGYHDQDKTLGTEMVQLAISRPMSEAKGPIEGTEGSFQTNFIADWDNPDGKPPMVQQAKERKALDD